MLKIKVLHENVIEAENTIRFLRNQLHKVGKLTWGIIPAAGKGLRFGCNTPKQYQTVCGEIILKKSISAIAAISEAAKLSLILVVLAKDDEYFKKLNIESKILADLTLKVPVVAIKEGKETRKDSVLAGLRLINNVARPDDWIIVHDAARPGLSQNTLNRFWFEASKNISGGILALKVNDTLKVEANNSSKNNISLIEKTLPREKCWIAQTPQMFPMEKLFCALQSVKDVTDESSAMESKGYFPKLIDGELLNLKITRPEDLKFMEKQLMEEDNANRHKGFFIGQGYDVHPLVKDRKLILGGVEIVHHTGLLGHSDADVLIHAIIDAILGASGLGDIGKLFPDNESMYKNADSRILLKLVTEKIIEKNLKINQIDSTVIAEKPKLINYIGQMVENLKEDTCCSLVNVKATTTEKLGYIGRQEGIAAQAVVSLVSTNNIIEP